VSTIVVTQAELDAAIAAEEADIIIKSPAGLWLVVRGSATVQAGDSATVQAWGSATVQAGDSATVQAWGSATVQAWGSATVRAWGSATVQAWDSATVQAGGSATVQAWDSATVQAGGSATVQAWGSATVQAWDSATVQAEDSATVQAGDSATVQAWGSATVRAGTLAVVRRFSPEVTITGGIVIDHTTINESDPTTWAGIHLAHTDADMVTLYKALDGDLVSGKGYRPVQWDTSGEVTCGDFKPTAECGHGLHLSPTTHQATDYNPAATRWLRCTARLADIIPIPGGTAKCKVAAVTVICEVDRNGNPIGVAA